jgi:hypothetical protein
MRVPVVVTLLIAAGAVCVAAPARAAQTVLAVLPTQSGVDDAVDAELVTNMMRAALAEQDLTLAPAPAVTSSATTNRTACQQSPIACARLVGAEIGAARVVASELFRDGGGFDLRVVVVDVKSGAEPGPWKSFKASDRTSLGLVAQQAAVQVARPEAYFGRLTVTMSPGAEVIVDGVARDRTPMFAPLQLSVGRHEVEVRAGRLVPWRGYVDISLEQLTTLPLCAPDDAVTNRCNRPTAKADTDWREPTGIAGAIGASAGAVGLVAGGGALVMANAAHETFAQTASRESYDAMRGWETKATVGFVLGGVLVVAGMTAWTISMVVE